jgi:long-chain acyl-CoA synthetase
VNLGTLLHERAERDPDGTALFCGARSLTFADLDLSTDRLAAWFLAEGLEPGDRVAVQWPNAIEVVQIYFAAFKAGLIVVPINLRLKPAETAWVLQHSGAALCFAAPGFADSAQQGGIRVLTELPATVDTSPLPRVDPTAPALLIYTSGSTGRPKGAVHTHQTLLATAELCTRPFEEAFTDAKPRGLLMTPMMHSSGVYVLLGAIRLGEPCVLLPAFDAGAALDAIEQFRCTMTLALPVLMSLMVEEQARHSRDLSSLRVMFAGGDSVPVPLQQRVRELTGAVVIEGLAMSETGPTIVNPVMSPRPGSLGLLEHGVEVRVVDPFGNPVDAGTPGELLVRSAAVCTGYWNDPEGTAASLTDGWFHTGDLVSRDADGYYWFRGRLKEIIIRGGSNISPQEVEEALYAHPDILEAGVIGVPHDVWGEIVVAAVALRQGATTSETEIKEFARRTLADYKVPERIHFLEVLPKGPTGKVHRKALKEALRAYPR